MKTIKTYLWFDSDAVEVAQTYAGMFQGAQMGSPLIMRGTPQGDTAAVDLRLPGLDILAFSLSGYFKFNPAGSLFVSCRTKEEVDHTLIIGRGIRYRPGKRLRDALSTAELKKVDILHI